MSAPAVELLTMSKTFVQVKTAVGGTRLVEPHDSLAGRHQALAAQGMKGTAQKIFFGVKVTVSQTRLYSSQRV